MFTRIVVNPAIDNPSKLRSQADLPICVTVLVDNRATTLRFQDHEDAQAFREIVTDDLERGADLEYIAASVRKPLPTGPTTTK